jgi:hypothetical protein
MKKRRKNSFLALCLGVAALALHACSQPPTAPAPPGPPDKVLKVVEAPRGDQTAEVIQRGEKQLVRLDGISGPEYEEIARVAFMVEGHHLAYEAKRAGKWLLVLDGKEWPLDAEVAHGSIRVSPDYRRLALLAFDHGHWQAMVDGRPHAPFRFIWAETLQFSPDSKRVGYLALEGNRLAVVVDGKVQQRLNVLQEGSEALGKHLRGPAETPAP